MINKHVYNTLFGDEIEINHKIFLYIDLVLKFPARLTAHVSGAQTHFSESKATSTGKQWEKTMVKGSKKERTGEHTQTCVFFWRDFNVDLSITLHKAAREAHRVLKFLAKDGLSP